MPASDASSAPRPVVFLDRDGVINASPQHQYIGSWDAFTFLPGSLDAIHELTRAGWPIFVISNQQGVARGAYTQATLDDITARMLEAVRTAGGQIESVLYCTHDEADRCACRKPQRGLIDQVCRQRPVNLAQSYLVGDDAKDVALGHRVGCRTILVLSGKTTREMVPQVPQPPEQVCQNLRGAAAWILAQRSAPS